ncbi:MAG TPA: hypothetical protein VHG28_13110 [Longimicrobiaceae bacterium]|nr:hypothetical protein [Longimicrobiaceae bacterium]
MDNQLFAGTVQSGTGSYPLVNVPVTLYEATDGTPRILGSARTDAEGRFSILFAGSAATAIFYATAHVSDRVVLMTIVGPEIRGSIVINELTSVAAAFSMAQFADGATLRGGASALRTAAGMAHNLVTPLIGFQSEVLRSPPNADQTNTLRSTNALANLVLACVRQKPSLTETFFELTTPPGGRPPADTFQALLNIARYPANNAGALWSQSLAMEVYFPALLNPVDAWTLAVKVNDSGDDDYLFGGPANIAFDRNGYAWISNNVVQGTPDSGTFIMVLQPDGKPARGVNGTAESPVFGGGLKGPGWGITIDPDWHVWVGNFGWGTREEYPHHGSVSEFEPDGTPLSGDNGYQEHTHRVQATVSDADGNIWMASYGNDRVVVYLRGNPDHALWAHSGSHPFGVAMDRDGNAWLTNGGGLGWPQVNAGTVTRFRINGGQLEKTLDVPVGYATKALAIDSQGYAWVASSGDSKVYRVRPNGEVYGGYDGGGIDTPWGIAVDGDDNVWVANFGRMGVDSDYTNAALSVLAGDTEGNRAAGLRPGDPISPPTGYTLHSGGDEVLLHNGQPLYTDGTECYSPLMRSTSCVIDRAGNVWVVNNWKPRFGTDFEPAQGNPGGDGIVIFVGLAKPPAVA